MHSVLRFYLSARGLEGDVLQEEDGESGAHHHAKEDEEAGEAVVGEEEEVMLEVGLVSVGQAHYQSSESLIGVDARNHREKGGEEAGLRRHLSERRQKHCEESNDECRDGGGSYDMEAEDVGIPHQETV